MASALRFGAISDIQYADVEDQRGRRYRATLQITARAVAFFNEHRGLDFVLHGGDIVDFYNTVGSFANDGGRGTDRAINAVMAHLSRLESSSLVCLIGNHEMYNWSREQLLRGVSWKAPQSDTDSPVIARSPLRFCPEGNTEFWHSFCPRAGWCCIVLDPYDVSISKGARPSACPF